MATEHAQYDAIKDHVLTSELSVREQQNVSAADGEDSGDVVAGGHALREPVVDGVRQLRGGMNTFTSRSHVYILSLSYEQPQGGTAITTDLSQNDRAVHIDFFNSRHSLGSSLSPP